MTLIAEPPDLFVAAYGQIGKFQRGVFLRIPLSLKGRNLYRQRVLRRFLASGAVRAAAARRTGVDLRLPTVTLGALPPYLLMTSEGNVGRGQTAVPRGISLTQQRVAAMLYAILAQRHFHTCPPLHSVYVEFVELRCPTILHIFCKLIIYCYLTNINR